MADVDSSSSEAALLPTRIEGSETPSKASSKLPRRKWTLLAITTLLNILLWSSLMSCGVTVYQIVSDTEDTSNLASEVLTLTSSTATFAHMLLHTTFAFKQHALKYQKRRPFIEQASYIAARFAATVCVLWLLTTGWNMIITARQPFCLPPSPSLQGWQAGPACGANRIGVAFSTIALIASFTLFYMLSTVRRPFEAHLFKHTYKPSSSPYNLTTPGASSPSLSPTSDHDAEKQPRTAPAAPSIWRALHPTPPSPFSSTHLPLPLATNPLPTAASLAPYKSRYYARPSISLTRPHRISGVGGGGGRRGSTAEGARGEMAVEDAGAGACVCGEGG